MSRLPIRLRLTLAFALAIAVVLAATGAFLHHRLGASLDETIDQGLEARAAELSPRLGVEGRAGPLGIGADDERFVQVLGPDGRVVAQTPPASRPAVVTTDQLERLGNRFELDRVLGVEGRVRVLATVVDGPRGRFVLLVGASLDDRDEAVDGLLAQLFIAGPATLLLASLLGYWLATAALRPVESMRAEAEAVSASEPGRRLPLPRARDELRRLGETLNAMLERLERAFERERGFVADASHELRTPLALLKGELELALRRPRSADELEQAVRAATAETDRLVRLAEDLLVLARADQGRMPLNREPIAVGELLDDAVRRFADGRPVEIEAPAGLRLTGDALRLEQALGNLLVNAFRHGSGPVRVAAVERDGSVELHVRDEGPGFPEGFLPHAFERFSRGDEARTGTGAGLGLAIVETIARAHGGSAHAANQARGADVWLSVPKA